MKPHPAQSLALVLHIGSIQHSDGMNSPDSLFNISSLRSRLSNRQRSGGGGPGFYFGVFHSLCWEPFGMTLALFGPWFPYLYNNGLRPGNLYSLSALIESSDWYTILKREQRM